MEKDVTFNDQGLTFNQSKQAEQKTNTSFDALVFNAFLFILPLFFLPINSLSLYLIKLSLIIVIVLYLFIKSIQKFLGGREDSALPLGLPAIFLICFAIINLISSFFSGSRIESFWGNSLEVGTTFSVILFTLSFLFALVVVGKNYKPEFTLKALYYSSVVTFFYYLFRILIIKSILPQKIALFVPDNLLGSHIDSAIFLSVGAIIVFYIYSLDLFKNTLSKNLSLFFVLLTTIFVGSVSFKPLIVLIVLLTFCYLVTLFIKARRIGISFYNYKRHLSIPIGIVLMIILAFNFVPSLNRVSSNLLEINNLEVSPSVSTTASLFKTSLSENFLLGTGPNMFASFWSLHKPIDVNLSQFWDTDFNFAFGLLPTMFISTGFLGTMFFLLFFLSFVVISFRNLFVINVQDQSIEDIEATKVIFLLSVFLWLIMFVYTPSVVLIFLCFVLTALSLVFSFNKDLSLLKISISNKNRVVPNIIWVCVFSVFVAYGTLYSINKIRAIYFLGQAVNLSASFDGLADSRERLLKSIRLSESDFSWRTLSEVYLAEVLQQIYTESESLEKGKVDDSVVTNIQTGISNSIESAKKAISFNPKDYRNHIALAKVYDTLASNGVQGVASNAILNYIEALKYNPSYPKAYLDIARMGALIGDISSARDYIGKAIVLKANYTDAYFTLAQIDLATNNVNGALQNVNNAILSNPSNPGLYFQLGLINYGLSRWSDAALAFEKSIVLIPNYANAKYFLGLSYYYLGATDKAISEFENIEQNNPDNQEVKLILNNLRTGKIPFQDAVPPLDDSPEKRTDLPI